MTQVSLTRRVTRETQATVRFQEPPMTVSGRPETVSNGLAMAAHEHIAAASLLAPGPVLRAGEQHSLKDILRNNV